MAKQTGKIKIEGVIDGVCFYKVGADYYARMHEPIQSTRFWNDKAFDGSRRSCGRLALGSRLASRVYKRLPAAKRSYAMFCQLKSAAILLLKQGVDEDTVSRRLELFIQPLLPVTKRKRKKSSQRTIDKNLRQKIRSNTILSERPLLSRIPNLTHERVILWEKRSFTARIRMPKKLCLYK